MTRCARQVEVWVGAAEIKGRARGRGTAFQNECECISKRIDEFYSLTRIGRVGDMYCCSALLLLQPHRFEKQSSLDQFALADEFYSGWELAVPTSTLRPRRCSGGESDHDPGWRWPTTGPSREEINLVVRALAPATPRNHRLRCSGHRSGVAPPVCTRREITGYKGRHRR